LISSLHAKWTGAKIYLAKPVRLADAPPSTPLAAVATMHGYIDDLIAEFDYVYPGIDETDLEGGDSYVTNLADNTHPNHTGYMAVAALWKTAMGQ
jgi:lysophospholipase L1-like esterase